MRVGFQRRFPWRSHGDNDYAMAIPWGLRDISGRTGAAVESCILRRLLTGPTRHADILFAGGTPCSCPFNMQPAPSRDANNTERIYLEHVYLRKFLVRWEKMFGLK